VELGKKPGMLGTIFRKAQNRIQDPAKLKRLISDLIGREQWTTLGVDVKGDAYEGLLEKNAADVKGGAGQYFTPRALIQAIVDVMRPEPGQLVHDPAAGRAAFCSLCTTTSAATSRWTRTTSVSLKSRR
jgi:type I restriction enzyme M protein